MKLAEVVSESGYLFGAIIINKKKIFLFLLRIIIYNNIKKLLFFMLHLLYYFISYFQEAIKLYDIHVSHLCIIITTTTTKHMEGFKKIVLLYKWQFYVNEIFTKKFAYW